MEEQAINAAAILGKLGGQAKTQKKALASVANGSRGGAPLRPPVVGQDGGVVGCSYIYAPRGQAGEYSALATNPYRGCGHKCAYCYVPKILRMDRADFDATAVERDGYLTSLLRDAKKYEMAGISEQVMLSFTSDPYHPYDTTPTTKAIEILQAHGLAACTLTKGGSRALRDLPLFRTDRDAFASTLTSMDDAFSRKWERGAASATDRAKTLQKFHEAGIFTWVSLEPTLDCDASLEIVRKTHEYVDLYKVGRINYLEITKTTDWEDYTLRMIDLLTKLGKKHYIKRDLQKYLPLGYYNPLRVPQHN